ncbi:MAG: hypothetical protein ABII64_00595 [Elusimicrobiota bacterium]
MAIELALVEENLGNLDKAYAIYKMIEKENKGILSDRYYGKYGSLCSTMRLYDQAEILLNKAIRLNNNDINAHNDLALVYEERKEYSKSEKEFLIALNINKKYVKAYINLGVLYARQ